MACETYEDGSWFCDNGNSWQYQDSTGYYEGYYDSAGNMVDANGLAVTISDTLSSIFGGGQRGYYAPNRTQGQYQYPGGYSSVTNRAGITNQGGNIGASISLPKWAIYGGVLVLAGYAFGFIKQGRR